MISAFDKAPDIVQPIMQRAIVGGTALLAKHTTVREVPFHTTNLLHSFRQEINPLMSRWFPTAKYAEAVQFGTKAHFPPYKDAGFQKWANDHGINAFVLARSISRKGTKANPYMERILKASKTEIGDLFEKALAKVTAALATT